MDSTDRVIYLACVLIAVFAVAWLNAVMRENVWRELYSEARNENAALRGMVRSAAPSKEAETD